MKSPPARTRDTFLTDDELLVFDFLTLGTIPLGCLCKNDYPFHMNCGYTHGLSDSQLLESIVSLAQLRFVNFLRLKLASRTKSPTHWVSFTLDGCELWENERKPDWDRFVECWVRNKTQLTIASPSRDAADACLSVSLMANRWQMDTETIKWELQRNYRRTGSFTFATAWVATVQIDPRDHGARRCDWNLFNARRTWWETINHLPREFDSANLGGDSRS